MGSERSLLRLAESPSPSESSQTDAWSPAFGKSSMSRVDVRDRCELLLGVKSGTSTGGGKHVFLLHI